MLWTCEIPKPCQNMLATQCSTPAPKLTADLVWWLDPTCLRQDLLTCFGSLQSRPPHRMKVGPSVECCSLSCACGLLEPRDALGVYVRQIRLSLGASIMLKENAQGNSGLCNLITRRRQGNTVKFKDTGRGNQAIG